VTSKIKFLLPFKDVEDKNIVRLLGGIPLFDDTLPFYTCVYAKKSEVWISLEGMIVGCQKRRKNKINWN